MGLKINHSLLQQVHARVRRRATEPAGHETHVHFRQRNSDHAFEHSGRVADFQRLPNHKIRSHVMGPRQQRNQRLAPRRNDEDIMQKRCNAALSTTGCNGMHDLQTDNVFMGSLDNWFMIGQFFRGSSFGENAIQHIAGNAALYEILPAMSYFCCII